MRRRLACLALTAMVLMPRGAGAYSVLAPGEYRLADETVRELQKRLKRAS